ncbi:hypothetical protein G6F24_014252 [Rhizopus arrhizus]|nr:hypothetical protein G6F24_014252 [Rhizopus arrhizus]
MHRNFFRSLSALAVSAALIGTAVAGPYPDKPITFVVPSAAGGSPDVLSRLITTQLARDTGATMVVENRPGAAGNIGIALVKRAAELNLTIVEDDPYGELRYAGEPQPGLIALAAEHGANVVRLGTFSKVLAPGLRLGDIAAARPLINKLVQAKQATDLHTPTLTQMAVYEIVKDGFLEEHLPNVREIYRAQGSCMLDAIKREFPSTVTWTKPEGGMFIWLTLPEHIDSTKLLEKAIAQNVAFVPGAPSAPASPSWASC